MTEILNQPNLGNGMEYLLEKNDHQNSLIFLRKLKLYSEHHEMVRERVKKKKESFLSQVL